MEFCVAHKEIRETTDTVREFSYSEKKAFSLQYEERINELLDTINDFKTVLRQKTERLDNINTRLEKLTWCNNLDEECLMLMNDLIALAKDLHSSVIRQYVLINTPSARKYAKQEIKEFKNSIDELKESYSDLDSVYFYLPKMQDFVDISRRLSLI